MENVPVTGRTYIDVPGYDGKILFGAMSSFAYPVDGLGECHLVSWKLVVILLVQQG